MARGKKGLQRTSVKTEDSVEHKVASEGTKENKPAANNKQDSISKIQSVFRSASKPRPPLSDSSSMLIQEGNEPGAASHKLSTLNTDATKDVQCGSCEPKQQKPETPGQSHGVREQLTDQAGQESSTRTHQLTSAVVSKSSASKTQSRNRPGARKVENKAPQNRKVTDYFPIRRSNRKTKAELKSEEHQQIDDLIKNGTEDGMKVKHIEGKGRGVFAAKGFRKGEFVVEYHGDLLELAEAKQREAQYALDPQTGCYMYYFQYQCKTYCVDATMETSRLGRLINHSKNGNCQTRLHAIDGSPHLILVASRDIKAEEELLYDYGDRSKASILAHPWLKQ